MNVVTSAPLPAAALREKVFRAEEVLLAREQVEIPVRHYFSKGVYGREIFIPKGTILTGKIHKYSQLNVLVSGDLSVLTEDGIKRVRPPFIIVSPAGTKRIAYAHENTIWLTVHGTNETDVEKIEQEFIAQSEQEYLNFCRLIEHKETKSCLG